MGDLIFDMGNFEGKWYEPDSRRQGNFMHAIAPLTDAQWRQAAGRGKPPKGIISVNGDHYAIGMAARRHTIQDRPAGAARYTQNYYGAALAYAMTEAFTGDDKQITLVASHPPVDQMYGKLIDTLACRDWYIESSTGHHNFSIVNVVPFDEPLGGYSNIAFNKDGTESKRNKFRHQVVLVVDVGGYTVDVVPVDPDGAIDYLGARSTRTGTLRTMRSFETEMRDKYPNEFQESGDLDPRRVEGALRTGQFQYGRVELDCADLATAAVNTLVNDVRQVIIAAGGIASYDSIILTGGGSALIYQALVEAVPQMEFALAADLELMRFANVFGGAKLLALLRRLEGE